MKSGLRGRREDMLSKGLRLWARRSNADEIEQSECAITG